MVKLLNRKTCAAWVVFMNSSRLATASHDPVTYIVAHSVIRPEPRYHNGIVVAPSIVPVWIFTNPRIRSR